MTKTIQYPRSPLFESTQPGGAYFLSQIETNPGQTFFVDSTHPAAANAAGGGRSPDAPLETIDYAIGLCQANQGDRIVVMPAHAESKTASGDLFTLDVAGVEIVGLRSGGLMPTLTLGHASATCSITAANCRIRGLKVIADTADVAVGFTCGASADGLIVEDCAFTSGSLTKELQIGISLAAACDDVTIQRCRFDTIISAETGSETHAIYCAGASDRLRVLDCEMIGNFGTAAIAATVAASVRVVIERNLIYNIDSTNGLAISLHASTSGIVCDNRLTGLKTNTVPLACAGCAAHENYTSAAVNESGIIRPAVETYA